MALKYHPDVRTNATSSEEEKKVANDEFAKINAAYAMLTGKDQDATSGGAGGSGSKSASTSGRSGAGYGTGYTPPHRRSSSYSSSTSSGQSSVDWEDFMPKYDDAEYDTNGDSFGAIFSDLFKEMGASAASRGRGGILNDLISFLEGNFPSVGTTQREEEDIILNSLLQNGKLEELEMELSDAKLLVKQLENKEKGLVVEMEEIDLSNLGPEASYMDQMGVEEKKRELEARKEVVQEYLQRAKVRQMKLKRRIDEIKLQDFDSFGNSGRSRSSSAGRQSSYYDDTSSRARTGADRSGSTSQYNNQGTTNSKNDVDDSWKREGFGSSGRRRGRGRSRPGSRSTASTASSSSSSSYSSSSSRQSYTSSSTSRSNSSTSSYTNPSQRSTKPYSNSSRTQSQKNKSVDEDLNLPPHRRLKSRYQQIEEDKRRLREIKVDEEIDRMKKDLGL